MYITSSKDEENCVFPGNSPWAGVCGCRKSNEDAIPWYPESELRSTYSGRKKKPVRRYNRENFYLPARDPFAALCKRLGYPVPQSEMFVQEAEKPSQKRKKTISPFPKTIPDTISHRHRQIHDFCLDFCRIHPNLEMEKPALDLFSYLLNSTYNAGYNTSNRIYLGRSNHLCDWADEGTLSQGTGERYESKGYQ